MTASRRSTNLPRALPRRPTKSTMPFNGCGDVRTPSCAQEQHRSPPRKSGKAGTARSPSKKPRKNASH
eukprot:1609361-Amphidinium_carterae.1